MRPIPLAWTLLVLGACSTSATPPDASGDPDGGGIRGTMDASAADAVAPDDATPDDVVAPPSDVPTHSYRTSIGPIRLAPGEEGTFCVLRRLGNAGDELVRHVAAHLGSASHHLIFYRSQATTEQLTPFRCRGFSGVSDINNPDTPFLIAQQAESALQMPPNVGMSIGTNQMVRIEFHVINTTDAPVEARGDVDVATIDRVSGYAPADVMFWGNIDIDIPARSRGQVRFFNRPWAGVRVFGLTSHTHHFGTMSRVAIATATSRSDAGYDAGVGTAGLDITEVREIHRSLNWSDPPFTTFEPALRLESGQGFYLECNYHNTSDTASHFGESFNDEMCFMWAYYYPAPRGTQICVEGTNFRPGVFCWPP
jgi:hypothetical protein